MCESIDYIEKIIRKWNLYELFIKFSLVQFSLVQIFFSKNIYIQSETIQEQQHPNGNFIKKLAIIAPKLFVLKNVM